MTEPRTMKLSAPNLVELEAQIDEIMDEGATWRVARSYIERMQVLKPDGFGGVLQEAIVLTHCADLVLLEDVLAGRA